MRHILALRCPELTVVCTTLGKTDGPIGSTKYFNCVIVILTVVLPETNCANLVATAFPQRLESATGTPKWEFIDAFHERL
jgi:hypothetical protein